MQPHNPNEESPERVAPVFGVRVPLAEAPLSESDRQAMAEFFQESAFGSDPRYRFDERGRLQEHASRSQTAAGVYPSPAQLFRRVVAAFENLGLPAALPTQSHVQEFVRRERGSTRRSLAEIVAEGRSLAAPGGEPNSPDFERLNEWLVEISRDGSLLAALRRRRQERDDASELRACGRLALPCPGRAEVVLNGESLVISLTGSREGGRRLDFHAPDGRSVMPTGCHVEFATDGVVITTDKGSLLASKRGVKGCEAVFEPEH